MKPEPKKKPYRVRVRYVCHELIDVEAASEEEAKTLAVDEIRHSGTAEMVDWDVVGVREMES